VTKELSKRTWPDYVRFFSQGNGWDHCGCTAYQGFRAPLDGVGEVNGSNWIYGLMHVGTVSMFEQEGFKAVSVIGSGPRVVMRRTIRGRQPSRR
jgi:hypothetical protein